MIDLASWTSWARGGAVFVFVLLIAVVGVLVTQTATRAADPVGIYVAAASLSGERNDHTATLLPDGRVFIAGGGNGAGTPLASTEIYDPATDTTSAGPAMSGPRLAHNATLLADGRVLITGGFGAGFVVVATAEIYDPGVGAFTPIAGMAAPRASHTATLLASGVVLVAGGFTPDGPTDTAELFDPGLGTWAATGSLGETREAASANLLADGTVLVAGGQGEFPEIRSSAEIYDPAAGSFSFTGSLAIGRWWHTHTLLTDGTVLFTGGNTDFNTGAPTDTVESYDPASGTFATLGTLDAARVNHSASVLPDLTLLIVGGGAATAERWDLSTDGFEPGGDPVTGDRLDHTATVLDDSRVYIAGGGSSTAELYVPDGIIVAGGSASVPDFAPLGTSFVEVFDATAGDISLTTDVYTFTLAATSLPFSSPSVSVSLTALADLPALAAAAPLPDGVSFLSAVALDVFVSGLASTPFSGPATITAVPPSGVAPGEVVAYGFIPLLVTSQTLGTPAAHWARLAIEGLQGDDTFSVGGLASSPLVSLGIPRPRVSRVLVAA